jgi:hypothetical protein
VKKYILSLILLIILITSFLPLPIHALTTTLTVNGEGTTYAVAGQYWGAPLTFVNMQSDDAATTTWISNGVVGLDPGYRRRSWNFTNTALPAGSTINSATFYAKARWLGSGSMSTYMFTVAGGTYAEQGATFDLTSYVLEDYVLATNPHTGLAWTEAEINAAEFGIKYYYFGTLGRNIDVTYAYVIVDYSPSTVPTTVTNAASAYTANSTHCFITMNGDITNDGGAAVTQRGFAWGTTCNSTTPASTQAPPATYTTNWTEGSADWGEGAYTYTTNLTCCSTYCYRAYSRNSVGWSWGEEKTFTMICEPDITTVTATYIASTTARLNSVVINDGGQLCDVKFCYGTLSGNCTDLASCTLSTCNCTSYNFTTPWVNNTYATGDTPYVDLSGLTAATTYYFCSQIQNDHACACGGQLSFTTSSGINEPTSFKGIARPTEISLFWIKGTGTSGTLVRGKIGSYPSSTLDGTEIYRDTQTSVVWQDLTSGTTYYFRAWGYSGATYSTSDATLIITTLGSIGTTNAIPAPTTPTDWYQAPDYTVMSNLPWYGMVNFFADSFEIPRSTLWFMGAMVMVLIAGVLTYNYGGQKILLSDIVCILGVGLAVKMGLAGMWLLVPFVIILFACVALGERL